MKNRFRAVVLALPIIAVPISVFAASGAAHHDGPPTSGQWLLLLFTFVNFAVFALLFRRFTQAPLRDFFRGRKKEVLDLIAAAAKERAEARQLREEYEVKVAALDQARAELIAEVRRMAEVDGEKTIAAAMEAADRMKRDAERTAASDVARAIRELRAEAARLATELATGEVERRLGADDGQRLLQEFLEGVERT